MSSEPLPTGPDPEAITRLILEKWPATIVAKIGSATFFSLDESHWPTYATIVWTDEHDMGSPSDLTSRPGVFRLNIGLTKETFIRLAGSMTDPDYAAFDRILPHPVYAKQRWVSILNPSDETFQKMVLPLLTEAHDRLAAQRERQSSPRVR